MAGDREVGDRRAVLGDAQMVVREADAVRRLMREVDRVARPEAENAVEKGERL